MNSSYRLGRAGYRHALFALSLASALTACGDSEQVGQNHSAISDSVWCDARKVLSERCVACHDGRGTGGSPMGLSTYSEMMADSPEKPGQKVWERMKVRLHADKAKAEGLGPMPPQNDLTKDELDALDTWLAAGAPTGDETQCALDAVPDEDLEQYWPASQCDEVYRVVATDGQGGKFQVPVGENHPQVMVDAPWGDEDVQAIAFRPITDNAKVLHHWILYDAGEGTLTFGQIGSGPFLTGWAPGDNLHKAFPPNVGMTMPKGKQSLRLDMHYFNTASDAKIEEDASGVEICVVKGEHMRPEAAAVSQRFSNITNLQIPPQVADYAITSDCKVVTTEPVHLMTASPHAHKLAVHMKFTVKKASGEEIVMHDGDFQFGEQASYELAPEVVLETGDVVTTTCVYTNTTDQTVTFGESTTSEMCFNFAVYYPSGALSCKGSFSF
ncbi:MAG: c-type cytochrome [Myxococcales bacterium]